LKRRHVAVQNELKKCRVGTLRYCSSISEHLHHFHSLKEGINTIMFPAIIGVSRKICSLAIQQYLNIILHHFHSLKEGNSVLVDVTMLFVWCTSAVACLPWRYHGHLTSGRGKRWIPFLVHLGLLMRDVSPPGSAGPHVNDSKHSAAEMKELSNE